MTGFYIDNSAGSIKIEIQEGLSSSSGKDQIRNTEFESSKKEQILEGNSMNSGKSNFEPKPHSLYSRKDSINDSKLLF